MQLENFDEEFVNSTFCSRLLIFLSQIPLNLLLYDSCSETFAVFVINLNVDSCSSVFYYWGQLNEEPPIGLNLFMLIKIPSIDDLVYPLPFPVYSCCSSYSLLNLISRNALISVSL